MGTKQRIVTAEKIHSKVKERGKKATEPKKQTDSCTM